jgi:FHS family L-fucose permease-like MFS transporter
MSQQKQSGNIVAIITMIFLFAMISFVTNLAAPIGVIWKNQEALAGSNFLGMLGNMMNFLAYLFMGIPAGKMLTKLGYKRTALTAIALGFVGVFVQYLSGVVLVGASIFSLPANFYVYLLGAFISGFAVCMLNTVVNPMLNLLGGGGNKGNQYIQIGGTFNSLVGTVTPMFIGALIGSITKDTAISNVNPILYIAMGVFAATFLILLFIPIADPDNTTGREIKFERTPWAFRHFVLGAIAIFIYVGVEVGIPGTLNFYLSDPNGGAGLPVETAVATAGIVAGTYWLMMFVGRLVFGSMLGGLISSKTQLTFASGIGILLILLAMFLPQTPISMPVFNTEEGFVMAEVPISALLLVLCGLCTSIMWGGIFNLAVEGLGKYTAQASGIFMMMVVGGGVLPLIQNKVADIAGYMPSYWVIIACLAFLLYYALVGCKNVNKDIPVD